MLNYTQCNKHFCLQVRITSCTCRFDFGKEKGRDRGSCCKWTGPDLRRKETETRAKSPASVLLRWRTDGVSGR